ncbi:MAG: CRISPR-associated helicase Cas3', partial [Candidatus Lokiarchaeota archaeon]|nr:CRISPR-associated helicase Cas3' [Candidatus Lokiarchaeota archaeon]
MAEDEMMAGAAYWQGLVTEGQQAKRVPRFEDRLWLARVLSLLKTADHMASGGILPVPIPRLAEFPMRPNLRAFQILAGNQRASAILKAPTGCGKTDAALAFARANQAKNGRLIYILPFQASLNAMFKRLVQFTTRPDAVDNDLVVGISHAKNLEFLTMFFESAEFGRGQEPPYDARSLKSLAREVYYPVKVSTAHQVLRFLLYGKGWDSLLLELADAVMIFDEIHAYDPRVLGFMIGLMKILRERFNVRFLIMTATIPTFIITLLQEHVFHDAPAPLLSLNPSESTDRAIIERHRHHVVLHDTCILDHVSSPGSLVVIKDRYQHGFTQLFVCNTVGTAQRVYELIKNDPSFDRDHVLLFHSRFNARDRNSKEERVIPGKRDLPATRILVATQVVEVSLDISYDFGYFEAAPIDAMIQRMGRVNRQGESRVDVTTLPNVHVFTKREYDGLIYDKDVVSRSIEHLRRLANHPLLEAEWDAVVDAVYPGFSTSEQAEFDHALRYQGIDGFADRFEAGLQQEWIAEIIEDVDHLIEILPAVCMAE